ncbi:MAG: response regulator [Deltaproteobacteria bacterium]|nr:response regulator [Deltaproteobacteria bacterium]
MLKLLLVSPDKDSLSGLASALAKHRDVDLFWAESGSKALDMISESAVDLVVTDESLGDMTGLEFASKLLSVNPMVNCASVSSLSSENFHEDSEGLGLLTQLPIRAGEDQAEDLLKRLKQIKGLTAGTNIGST